MTDTVSDLPPQTDVRVKLEATYAEARKEAILAFERAYVHRVLERTSGNVSEAARIAKIDRVYLHRLIRRHRAAPRLAEQRVQGNVMRAERNPGERWEALKALWQMPRTVAGHKR